jgi:serine/threonine protein kinase
MSHNQSNKTEGSATKSPQSTRSTLKVCFGGHSTAGLKAENQDAFAALVPSNNDMIAKGVVATICDGVSSANRAADAAQISVTQFINDYYATPDTWSTQKSASKVLTSLNQWLFSQTDSQSGEAHQWLTTFSSLIIKSSTGYIFHVGDTRICVYRQNDMEIITRDHNRRSGNGSAHVVLTRALGADPRLEVDVHQIDIKAGDIYVLTCDGVHDFLSGAAIQSKLKTLPDTPSNEDLELVSRSIVDFALEMGSNDNISCLLVYVGETPNRELVEIERDLLSKTIPPALDVGMKIDGYKVCKVVHASIRSHLYLVEHESDPTPKILKVPSENFADDIVYLQGFMREAWIGERVDHRNVMKVKSATPNSRFLYHVCEYIEGQTLGEWIHDNPQPSIAQVREIVEQVIMALRTFQRLDLVHRDLKPDNIMIDAYGKVTLIDYGTVLIASLEENSDNVAESVPQGSLNYIAPETLLTMHADHKSDLFSLGVIVYEMLCGSLPYKPMVRAEVNFSNYNEFQYISIKHVRDDLPLWVDLALKKSTQADPALRYQAFSEFFADLSKPNVNVLQEYKKQPIMERNPIQFWQGMSAILFVALIVTMFI